MKYGCRTNNFFYLATNTDLVIPTCWSTWRCGHGWFKCNTHSQTFNIRHTKSLNLYVYLLIMWLSLPNPLKLGVKSRMEMQLEQRWRCSWSSTDRWCSNYIWVINNFIAYQGVDYIRGLMVGFWYIMVVFNTILHTLKQYWNHNVGNIWTQMTPNNQQASYGVSIVNTLYKDDRDSESVL